MVLVEFVIWFGVRFRTSWILWMRSLDYCYCSWRTVLLGACFVLSLLVRFEGVVLLQRFQIDRRRKQFRVVEDSVNLCHGFAVQNLRSQVVPKDCDVQLGSGCGGERRWCG